MGDNPLEQLLDRIVIPNTISTAPRESLYSIVVKKMGSTEPSTIIRSYSHNSHG